jgi:hypothetical protein
MGIKNHNLVSRNLNDTKGSSLVIAVIVIQTNCKTITILIGCVNMFLSNLFCFSWFKKISNNMPKRIGSVGRNKPMLPPTNNSIFADKGVLNIKNKNSLSK